MADHRIGMFVIYDGRLTDVRSGISQHSALVIYAYVNLLTLQVYADDGSVFIRSGVPHVSDASIGTPCWRWPDE